jgi:hypothetical protein
LKKKLTAPFLGVTFRISLQAVQLPVTLGSAGACSVLSSSGNSLGMANPSVKGGLLKTLSVFLLSVACCFAQANVPLGSASTFAVLAGSTITSTGATAIAGNVGVAPGSAITGLISSQVTNGIIEPGDGAVATTAQNDLTTAYNDAAGEASSANLTGQNLGGLTLGPGVYTFNTSAQLTGTLTLTGAGFYIFQIGSTLTTASSSVVAAINGADAANIFWQVGSSATLGTGSTFIGNILAEISITSTTGVTMAGRLLARNGAVTLDDITLNFPPATTPGGFGGGPLPVTPVPSSWILVLIGLVCATLYQTRERWLRRLKRS